MLYMTSSGMYVYNSKHIQTERYGGTHYKIVSTLPSLYSNVALSLFALLFMPPLFTLSILLSSLGITKTRNGRCNHPGFPKIHEDYTDKILKPDGEAVKEQDRRSSAIPSNTQPNTTIPRMD